MSRVLYLFPDTNVFFQCQPLDQVDWRPWKDFDEIHVIICRPIQDEIDKYKGKGSDRRSNRARVASRLIGNIIKSGTFKLLQTNSPTVKLFIRLAIKPSPDLAGQLDYTETDDRLVGVAHAFERENPGADVRVLTDDNGVLATAVAINFPYIDLPDNWLLEPETSDEQKRIAALEKENQRLKSPEPRVLVECLDLNRNKVGKQLQFTHLRYPPLDQSQVEELMTRLREECPVATAFGSAEQTNHLLRTRLSAISLWDKEYVAATDAEIAEYRDEKYPKWLKVCRDMLGRLHELLNAEVGRPTVSFAITNEGTRPGDHVLVTFSASGNFLVMPPKRVEPDDKPPKTIALPTPPFPPEGKWQPKHPHGLYHSGLLETLQHPHDYRSPMDDLLRGLRHDAEPFDPNDFYYKNGRPTKPVASFSRNCMQWRHSTPAEELDVEICIPGTIDTIKGLLECRVEAQNLSDPVEIGVPIRIVVDQADTYQRAIKLVEKRTKIHW